MGRELFFTLAQMGEEPLAAPHLPAFQAHRATWQTVLLTEIGHLEAMAKAQAAVTRADNRLDALAGRVEHAVKEIPQAAIKAQLKKKLFKGKSLSKFRRPVLGRQLADMRDWAAILAGSGVPSLVALASEAASLYAAAEAADAQREKAEAANRMFRDLGERKAFVDGLNASRKEADGALAKLPFTDPSLPQDFNDAFFYSEAPSDEDETIDDLSAAVEALKQELKDAEARLAAKQAEAAEAAKAAEEMAANDRQAAELEAQAAALLAQAGKLRGK